MLLRSILTREGLLMVTGDESLLLRNVVELLRLPELLLRLLRLSDLLLRLLRLSEWLLRLCQPLRRSLADLGRAVGGLVLLVGQETLLAVDLLLLGDVDQLGLAVSHRNLPEIFDNINIWSNVVFNVSLACTPATWRTCTWPWARPSSSWCSSPENIRINLDLDHWAWQCATLHTPNI